MKGFIHLCFMVFISSISFAYDIKGVTDSLILKNNETFKDIKVIDTKFENVYKLNFINGDHLYYNNKEDFFFTGDILKYDNSFKNITKLENKKINKIYIDDLVKKYGNSLVHYPSTTDKVLTTIYIFSDFTCPFCKKLHNNITNFQKLGIDIYYIPFPRKTMNDYDTVKGLQKIICSSSSSIEFDKAFYNPKEYIKNVKDDETICNASLDIMAFNGYADKFKVKGTPTIITKEGSLISGFSDANHFAYELKKAIDADKDN